MENALAQNAVRAAKTIKQCRFWATHSLIYKLVAIIALKTTWNLSAITWNWHVRGDGDNKSQSPPTGGAVMHIDQNRQKLKRWQSFDWRNIEFCYKNKHDNTLSCVVQYFVSVRSASAVRPGRSLRCLFNMLRLVTTVRCAEVQDRALSGLALVFNRSSLLDATPRTVLAANSMRRMQTHEQ